MYHAVMVVLVEPSNVLVAAHLILSLACQGTFVQCPSHSNTVSAGSLESLEALCEQPCFLECQAVRFEYRLEMVIGIFRFYIGNGRGFVFWDLHLLLFLFFY